MKVKNVNATNNTRALVKNASVDAGRGIVSWGPHDEVRFTKKNGKLYLERATADFSFQTVFLSTTWGDFNDDQKELIIAAVLCTGNTSVIIASQIVQINAVICEAIQPKPEHATSWKNAQEHGLSGYRKETPKVTVSAPNQTVKVEFKGKAAVAVGLGLAVLGLGLLVMRSN